MPRPAGPERQRIGSVGSGVCPAPALPTDHEDREIGVQVGIFEHFDACFGVQGDLAVNSDVLRPTEIFEIGNRQKPDVGCVEPFVV